MSINDQIAALGAQLETAILDTYSAVPDGGMASLAGQPLLAFLPGDIAVPVASFVEPVVDDSSPGVSTSSSAPGGSPQGPAPGPAGAVNPLLITSWLKSDAVGADTPLLVQTNQTTVIGGPPGGFTTMSELYFDLLDFAQPLAAVGSPAADQFGQLLIWAKQDLPASPDDLPLLTQPGDWPLPDVPYWNQFSFTSTAATPAAGAPGGPTPPPTPPPHPFPDPRPDPVPPLASGLWGLRFMPERSPEIPAQALGASPIVASGGGGISPPMRMAAEPVTFDTPVAASVAGVHTASILVPVSEVTEVSKVTDASTVATPATTAPGSGSDAVFTIDRPSEIARPPLSTFLAGLAATSVNPGGASAPPVQTEATQISLEHMLVSIDRSSWWHNDWLVDPNWYVPGEPRGSSVGLPSDTSQVLALAVALILVQNLTVTGSWSSADISQLTSAGTMLGPFNLGGATTATNADSTATITVPGPSVVGLFCQPLVVLPPADTPPTPPSSEPTTGTASGDPSSPPPAGDSPGVTPPAGTGETPPSATSSSAAASSPPAGGTTT